MFIQVLFIIQTPVSISTVDCHNPIVALVNNNPVLTPYVVGVLLLEA